MSAHSEPQQAGCCERGGSSSAKGKRLPAPHLQVRLIKSSLLCYASLLRWKKWCGNASRAIEACFSGAEGKGIVMLGTEQKNND